MAPPYLPLSIERRIYYPMSTPFPLPDGDQWLLALLAVPLTYQHPECSSYERVIRSWT